MNQCIQNAETNPVSIILAVNHCEITHNGACVPTSRQDAYLADAVDYYSHCGDLVEECPHNTEFVNHQVV